MEGEEESQALKVPQLLPSEAAALDSSPDSKADQEARQFAAGKSELDLAREAKVNEHGRAERFKDHFERLAKHGLTLAFWVAMIFAGVWTWHVLMPVQWRWLQAAELDHLQNLITGGVLASLASDHFRKRLS